MLGKALTTAAAGSAAGAAGGLGIEDVFSTWLYTGTGGAHTITNGIDFSGEGGLAWIKERDDSAAWHYLFDTERGATKVVSTNTTSAEFSTSSGLTSFTSSGFTLNTDGDVNGSGDKYVSWNFRKAPGFFDVVTYTGNGTAGRTVSHNLGSVPGFIMVKELSTASNWICYHRSTGNDYALYLNRTDAADGPSKPSWNQTSPTSTEFTVGVDGYHTNDTNITYVAYLFAHDEQIFGESGSESVIKCGTYTEPSSGTSLDINLGWEPQWILWKRSNNSSNWYIFDTQRGWTVSGQGLGLLPDGTNAETDYFGGTPYLAPTATGFTARGGYFGAGSQMIYIAIRRGPMKTPTDATDVFSAAYKTGSPGYQSGFPIDMAIREDQISGSTFGSFVLSRLTGTNQMATTSTLAETNNSSMVWDYMNGFNSDSGSSTDTLAWMFRRAPGFFDVVTYTGTGSQQTISHNLGVTPELFILKARSTSSYSQWNVWVPSAIGISTAGSLYTAGSWAGNGNLTAITASSWTTGTNSGGANTSGGTHIAYLFASLDGISKVGSYTGTASTLNVDCGFSAGARFVLIKRTDSTGDWYVWDTTRGIVSGNDPYLLLNSTAAEVTTTDYIDPYSAGFTVTSSAPAALNASGGSYIFLSIA